MTLEERASLRFSDAVIFSGAAMREIVESRVAALTPQRATIVNAPDTLMFDSTAYPRRARRPGDPFRIVYVGTVSDRHGVDQAVEAAALLRDRIPDLVFDIYPRFAEGEGEPLEALQRRVAELDFGEVIRFHDPVPLETIPGILGGATVGVFTPHVDVHIDIALSVKVPEMVAMRLPIVATRTKVMEGYFGDDQILFFDDGDIEACAAAIESIYRSPLEAQEMAERATGFFDTYAWELEQQRYVEFVESTLRSRGAGRRHPAG
jgi:glycosyltransferase involved in cell wall biosynthesis